MLFLNYAFETAPPLGLALSPTDEPNRACIQLYHHVATPVDLRGRKVLEVSCGHGGGASYLARTLQPAHYTALDLNRTGIAFCRKRHPLAELDFLEGDARHLMFADHTFDAVLNVEASHCYPDFPGFLAEVSRVLRPGGHFLYADFRFHDGIAAWERALQADPKYLKTYLQAARLALEEGRTQDTLELTDRALEQKPIEFPGIYFFNAVAHFNLKQMDAAETSVRAAIEHDNSHEIPRAHGASTGPQA